VRMGWICRRTSVGEADDMVMSSLPIDPRTVTQHRHYPIPMMPWVGMGSPSHPLAKTHPEPALNPERHTYAN
jgi:hypothetical protein